MKSLISITMILVLGLAISGQIPLLPGDAKLDEHGEIPNLLCFLDKAVDSSELKGQAKSLI